MKTIMEKGKVNIDITNACIHSCSNCTRFCGHYKKPFFMNYETFKKAVDSLDDFEGILFIIGGEPTLHPEFEHLIKYAENKRFPEYKMYTGLKPLHHYISYREQCTSFGKYALNTRSGLNLATCLPENYYRHYELINDLFAHQLPNDHSIPSKHQPILISRKELNIPDDKWIELRDNCWLQNNWSATITPKGAFFCEVAASLDILFDGPGGWPIEKGWWKRTIEEYEDQLHWCEYCSMPVFDLGRYDNEGIDDISPYLYEKLKICGNNNLKEKNISMVLISEDGQASLSCEEMYSDATNRYMSSYDNRFTLEKSAILPKSLTGIVFYNNNDDIEELFLFIDKYIETFDEIFIIVDSNEVQGIIKNKFNKDSIVLIKTEKTYNKMGHALNKVITNAKKQDWFVLLHTNTELLNDFRNRINKCVLNPGVLHKINGAYMFNSLAKTLKSEGFDGIAQCENANGLEELWDERKVIEIDDSFDKIINPDLGDWIELSKGLPEPKRIECLTKLDYIRRLIVLEYYRSYIADRNVSFPEKVLSLNDCLPQIMIENITESLKEQLKDAIYVIMRNENIDRNDYKIKEKLAQHDDIFSELALSILEI